MKTFATLAFLIATALGSHFALAQSQTGAATPDEISTPPRGAAPTTAAKGGPAGPHDWDYWYTVTVSKNVPYEYYHETIETKEGRLVYKLHAWKKEEDFINEEQLGAFAQAADLAPLFFNFHATYRGTEKTVDGNIQGANSQSGGVLVVKSSEGGATGGAGEKPLIRVSVPKQGFLSSFFPLWLARQGQNFKSGRALPFSSILEDGGDDPNAPFATAAGNVKPLDAHRFEVNFRNQKSIWSFDAQGAPTRIEMPASHAIVERVTESTALKFFGKK